MRTRHAIALCIFSALLFFGIGSPVFAATDTAFAATLLSDDINTKLVEVKASYRERPISELLGKIIQVLLSVMGIIFLLLTVYGGFEWLTAAGDEKKVTQALGIITQALTGLVIVLAAYAITVYISNALQTAVGYKLMAP